MSHLKRRIYSAVVIGLVGSLILLAQRGSASQLADAKKEVQAIADAIQKGDEPTAKMLAKKTIDKEDGLYDAMRTMKPRPDKAQGFGVGAIPGAILPDGIEQKVQELAKNGINNATLKKEAPAHIEMGYRINAIAHGAQAIKQPKNQKQWDKFAKEMNDLSQNFIKSVKTGKGAEVQKAAAKMNANCNQCHAVYR